MVNRIAIAFILALGTFAARAEEPRAVPHPHELSICTLLEHQQRYSEALIEIHGVIVTNGIDAVGITDPRCKDRGVINMGAAEPGANEKSLEQLFKTVQLAYVSSTEGFSIMVEATMLGRFYRGIAANVRGQFRPKDVEGMRLINGASVLLKIPHRARKE